MADHRLRQFNFSAIGMAKEVNTKGTTMGEKQRLYVEAARCLTVSLYLVFTYPDSIFHQGKTTDME